MATLRELLVAADGPQPDILAKKSQSDQFKVSFILVNRTHAVFSASNCVTLGNGDHLFYIHRFDLLHLH